MARAMGASAYTEALHMARTREYTPFAAQDDDEGLLVEAAAAGSAAAFAALYDRHLDRVYRQCYYRLGNRADAEDLAQQTFLQAWQAMPRYRRSAAPFVAWLLTISHNLIVSKLRKTREVTDPNLELAGLDDDADPETTALDRLATDSVRQALQLLRPDRQQVLVLRFIEGFNVEEVAAAMGKSPNNVRVIQHRALHDLRRLLGLAEE